MALADSTNLCADPTFQGRVRAALISTCIAIASEAWTTAFHRERQTYAASVMNSPDTYKLLFANSVATDPTSLAAANVKLKWMHGRSGSGEDGSGL